MAPVVAVSVVVSPLRSVQVPQVGLVAQVRGVAVQARYWTS